MPHSLESVSTRLRTLAESWAPSIGSERAAFQGWLIGFCEALDVPAPVPPTAGYTFELPVRVTERDGRETTNFIDCWKAGHFALEAKATDVADGNDAPLRKAFGQVRNYAAHTKGASPPYLMVVDVPRTLIVWDRWSGEYGGFPAGHRINLATLHERPDDIRLLQDIFIDPAARDPRGRAQVVTKEIAGKLAELSAAFEDRGHEPELVARFLMRCVFCFFAEDVDLLPRGLFKRTLETARTAGGPDRVGQVLTSLWKTMDEGGSFGADLVRRFNGHFFKSVEALPLQTEDVTLLIDAAAFDWSRVEPSIFGTLLVRALDPAERHRLGAEYTPREYIERLVEPTVVEPIRDRWTAVQAHVLQITDDTDKKAPRIKKDRQQAVKELLDFHAWMRGLRFLDPACGSGNFLYVTMAAVKRVEVEVIREIERVRGKEQAEAILEEVHPRQFHGIEVKPWAREIAELTLWIGYHQFWRETHGGRTPPDPVLEDTGTIECRDAVLAWDEIVHRPEKDRPDPTPRIVHPVTGEMVPDPTARLPYYEYVGARKAEWPEADFIIGNPPYLGSQAQSTALGDGYVEAVRRVHVEIPDSADLVMYFWTRAGKSVADGRTLRSGLITTSSITQSFNRRCVEAIIAAGAYIVWASPSHPWAGDTDGASVRVAMTVLSREDDPVRVYLTDTDGIGRTIAVERLNADLSAGPDVSRASQQALTANAGLVFRGASLIGDGFRVNTVDAERLLRSDAANPQVLKPLINGQDLTARPRGEFVIDFGMSTENEAKAWPVLYDIVRDRVKPVRAGQKRKSYRDLWWRLAEPRPELREAIKGIGRFIATPMVARFRAFSWLSEGVLPDQRLMVIATDSATVFGVLSSTHHLVWAEAAGGTHGVGNDPVYNNAACFDPFPFPMLPPEHANQIAEAAEHIHVHRRDAIARDESVTTSAMYGILEKLRTVKPLTSKEMSIHALAACGVLRDLHDELDKLVAAAYGWPWPMKREELLERLVALHDERIAEERAGQIRWLRPDYQIRRFAPQDAPVEISLPAAVSPKAASGATQSIAWPTSAVEQLGAVKSVAARVGTDANAVLAAFSGADEKMLRRHLETLSMMGELGS